MWCSADPCKFVNDGTCDVPRLCATGDYIDCGSVGPVVNGTLPNAIGSLTCTSKIIAVYAHWSHALVPARGLHRAARTLKCGRPLFHISYTQ
jgi:hypothetical protein